MHVASKDEIEFFEFFFDGLVCDVDGGVNEHNFGLFLRKFSREFGRFVELFEQNIYILATGMKNVALFFGDIVEVVVGWRKSKAKDVKLVVFVTCVVEIMDAVNFTDCFDESIVVFGDVAAIFAEPRFKAFFLSIEIMIAEA